MKLIDPAFKLSEEILDTLIHFTEAQTDVEDKIVFKTVNKTKVYVNRAMSFLLQVDAVQKNSDRLSVNKGIMSNGSDSVFSSVSIIKKAITKFKPFEEFLKLIQNGKTEKNALKIIRTTYDIEDEHERIQIVFEKFIKYLKSDIPVIPIVQNKVSTIPSDTNFFWIDKDGKLVYDEKAHTEQIISLLEKKKYKNPAFIDQKRIEELKLIKNDNFDLSKLIKICNEINDNYRIENYISVGILVRAILDHIPPIFGKKSFTEIANNYGTKSFRDVMLNLENFSRKVADSFLHTHIRKREGLPNATTIECKIGIDVLLGEINSELK
jgi:hypothetical protein